MCHCKNESPLGEFKTAEAKQAWLVIAPALSAYIVGKNHGVLAGVGALLLSLYLIKKTGGDPMKVVNIT